MKGHFREEVKTGGRSYVMLLCLEAWRRHHFRSLQSSSGMYIVSHGNVGFERGVADSCGGGGNMGF